MPATVDGLHAGEDDIVLVDDDPLIAEFVERVLRRHPRRLRVFADPLAALEHLRRHTAEVLLVDTRMPGMDGPELLVRLMDEGCRGGRHVVLSSAGPVPASAWTERLPEHVAILSKDVLFDRRTLPDRLDAWRDGPAAEAA